jgi:hypothetical protein
LKLLCNETIALQLRCHFPTIANLVAGEAHVGHGVNVHLKLDVEEDVGSISVCGFVGKRQVTYKQEQERAVARTSDCKEEHEQESRSENKQEQERAVARTSERPTTPA